MGRQRQQTLRLGDEGRSRARPRRERHDQDGGHMKYAIASIAPLERWCREYRAEARRRSGRGPSAAPEARNPNRNPNPRAQELAEQVALFSAKVVPRWVLACRAQKSRDAREAPSSDCSQGGDNLPDHLLEIAGLRSTYYHHGRARRIVSKAGRGADGTGDRSAPERVRPPAGAHVPRSTSPARAYPPKLCQTRAAWD